jgi:hypothetical protein
MLQQGQRAALALLTAATAAMKKSSNKRNSVQ